MNIGILGLGLFLPETVRRNDHWPAELVAAWSARRLSFPPPDGPLSEGARTIVAALGKQTADPFQGTIERHVIADGQSVFDLGAEAGRRALARAGTSPDEIDVLLTFTATPDWLLGNAAAEHHRRLGLPARCLAIETDGAANAFLLQLGLAESMIAAGRARRALLIQVCAGSRLVDPRDPLAPLVGDGAAAAVIGPVSAGRGLASSVHFADGRFAATLVAGVRGGRWHDEGRGGFYIADMLHMRDLFLMTADVYKQAIDAALAQAGATTADIDFFGMDQGTPWMRPVVQDFVGLGHARSSDTFTRTGHLLAALPPTCLFFAEQEGLLRPGDLAMVTGGGTGITYSAAVLRWGT